MSGLQAAEPTPAESRTVAAMTGFTFRLLRQRWNMNTLRLPVSPSLWERDGDDYLGKVAGIVGAANQEGLIVVIAAFEDGPSRCLARVH